MLEHVYLIPLIPLCIAIFILLVGKEDPHSPLPYLAVVGMGLCLLQSLAIFWGVASGQYQLPYQQDWSWFTLGATSGGKPFAWNMPIGVLIDGPAAVMLVVVTFVSFLVHLYSLGYMHDDPRFKRFFAYLSFFTASMLGLVVSSNLFVTFACWELMGVSSYLLIGFWFERQGPPYASKKAFITTKLGDLGLYLALYAIFHYVGSFQIPQIAKAVEAGYIPGFALTAIALGILAGAAGKSAQFPLFIWLPDAMEGPTPVSALIHAATMVAAGIYLVAKTYFIFLGSPVALSVVAWTGALTALMAASMALVAYDIKRVLAFSTVSQLGFMMCALGALGYSPAIFHLTTHAFFKAMLFLCAGSVIHAVHTNDMREMGGLSKKMPITFLTMALGTVAIAGIPPLSGFWSKEAILAAVYEKNPALFFALSAAALMTAFYMTRMVCLTFFGKDRDHEKYHHAHESPATMWVPLVALALPTLAAGWALHHGHFFENLVSFPIPETLKGHAHFPHAYGWIVTGLAACSMALGWHLYGRDDFSTAESIKASCAPIFNLLERRYYLDDLFLALVALSDKLARAAFWFDSNVLDRFFVDGWGLITRIFAEISHHLDALWVDRTVDGFGGLSWDLGVGLRSLVRSGQIQEYLMYVAIAFSLFGMLILSR
jgi:NADH-quinone oxidoreductase subunit L